MEKPPSYVVFGAQQRRIRELRGMTRQQLSEKIPYSADQVRKVERGERRALPDYIRAVDAALEAQGLLVTVGEEVMKGTLYPAWFAEYVDAEATATSIDWFDNYVVPGLLQTEEYARAVLSAHYPVLDDEEVTARAKARIDRQALLSRKPAAMLSFVVDETVLRRPIGGTRVLKTQLLKLAECARMRHVTLQVLSLCCESHAGLDGPMTLLETADTQRLAYVEYQGVSRWFTKPREVSAMAGRYGTIRAEALSPEDPLTLIEKAAGEL